MRTHNSSLEDAYSLGFRWDGVWEQDGASFELLASSHKISVRLNWKALFISLQFCGGIASG